MHTAYLGWCTDFHLADLESVLGFTYWTSCGTQYIALSLLYKISNVTTCQAPETKIPRQHWHHSACWPCRWRSWPTKARYVRLEKCRTNATMWQICVLLVQQCKHLLSHLHVCWWCCTSLLYQLGIIQINRYLLQANLPEFFCNEWELPESEGNTAEPRAVV